MLIIVHLHIKVIAYPASFLLPDVFCLLLYLLKAGALDIILSITALKI